MSVTGGIVRPAGVGTARVSTAGAVALTVTLGLAAACWAIAVLQMSGMAMGVATELGSFGFFIAVWVAMMAAMMLPGLAPAVVRRAGDWSGARAVPLFAVSYLAVWALVGVAVYEVDRPHGTLVAGAVTVAAGLYEFTPAKQHFRRRCRDMAGSGFGFGLCCLGSGAWVMSILDGGDHRRRERPEVAAAQGGQRRAGGAGDHRARPPDHRRARRGSRPRPADVITRCH